MNDISALGKILIIIGLVIVALGVVLTVAKYVPFLGRLPGDIVVKRENFRFYFPITTCIVISIILSALFYFFSKR